MTLPKIEERTLYPPIINHLEKIGFKAVGETRVIDKHPDIYFQVDSLSFVIEIKIGKPEIGLKAVAQASDYAKKLKTQNIVILIYPEKYRNQQILSSDSVTRIALEEEINALVLTEYWTENLVIKPIKLFEMLKFQILAKTVKVDFKTIVKLIESYVKDLNAVVFQIKAEQLISEVVDKLDLFSSIGEIKDQDTAKRQVMNLASFLLFNQLLFYHIYKRKAQNQSLPDLEEINKIRDLQKYIDYITKIDYQSIYRINILGHIPEKKEVIDTLNDVIKALILLRAEHITHDLAGRFFHDLIPFEVRKVLAAFYTHPTAAEILAGLTIESWDEKVIDPACGSGTLLVSSYKRKKNLYEQLYGFKNLGKLHKGFIENDLTGIDIMPFAAHITTINLTTQNIEEETNIVRIGCKDSLSLVGKLKDSDFAKKGVKISTYTEEIQHTIFDAANKKVMQEGAISANGKGENNFYLQPCNVVIMNPPFSDREKMPLYMRERLKKNTNLTDICGNQVNLWGYFLVLANFLLLPEGKIGAVIPINIARGKATEKIRNFLLDNYTIEYIIKPVGDLAFSEGSSFRDVLLIAKKRKPHEGDTTKVVFLKKSIRDIKLEEADSIYSIIRNKSEFIDNKLEIKSITYQELKSVRENLMVILSPDTAVISEWLEALDKSDKLIKINKGEFPEGFHASPKGLSQLIFVTVPSCEERIKRAFLISGGGSRRNIFVKIKDMDKTIEIPKANTYPSLRTLTGIKTIGIKNHDYFIHSKYKEFEFILSISKWDKRKKIIWDAIKSEGLEKSTHLIIPERFNPYSPNTHLLAFFSAEKLVVPHTLRTGIKFKKDDAKIQSLFMNSTIFLAQIFLNKEETTGEYLHIMESDLILMKLLDIKKISEEEKKDLYEFFKVIQNIEFPSILEQLENRFEYRVKLDEKFLKIFGFSNSEINKWLPRIYNTLIDQIKTMKAAL